MPKKAPKNAFFFFMLEFKEQEQRKGRHYSMQQLATAADEPWKKMNAQQRGPYEKLAKEAKLGLKQEVQKYTSQGIPVSVIEKEIKQQENEFMTMIRTISHAVKEAFNNNTIGSQELTFISGNYFINDNGNYFPAELAMVTMTFESGIVKKFHTYVDPENLPIGCQFGAQDHSGKTHRLPLPPKAKGERDYSRILHEMQKFMGNPDKILYTTKDNIKMIKSFIQSFIDYRGSDEDDDYVNANHFRVYPLHQLFYDIKEEAVKNSVNGESFKSIHIAEEHLKKDDYVYLAETACAYHEELDCAKHCALAQVQNWAYIFLDFILVDLNIETVSGKHFPPQVDLSHVAEMTRTDLSTSQFNDTISFVDEPEKPQNSGYHRSGPSPSSLASAAEAVPNTVTPHWGSTRARSPVSSNRDDEFPSLGSHNRRAVSTRNRVDERDLNNPWNTSSSTSSNDSNAWNHRQSRDDDPFRGSDLDSSRSRGMGRGSLLYRHESGFGRGRKHNDRTATGSNRSNSSHHNHNSKRYYPFQYKGDRSKKRRH